MGTQMVMQWDRLLDIERLRRPAMKPLRFDLDPFHLDLDRIMFSQPFRRLKDKTQVHPLSDNDHVRTRLTHSLEVAAIGYTLGALVGPEIIRRHQLESLRPDGIGSLVHAACLAHDIGNPPFGHIGEYAIREWFCNRENSEWLFNEEISGAQKSDFHNFDGNAQGFRTITQLENYKGDGGLQLTYATLGALMKYPWPSDHRNATGGKFGFFQSEKHYAEEIAGQLGLLPTENGAWCRHPLAYLVEAADDICYAIIDLEDGIDMGAFSFKAYEGFVLRFLESDREYEDWRVQYQRLEDHVQKISYLRSKAITRLVDQAYRLWLTHEEAILHGGFEGDLLNRVEGASFVREAKEIAKLNVFPHPRKIYIEIASHKILHGLLHAFSMAAIQGSGDHSNSYKNDLLLALMGRNKPQEGASRYEALRKVVDFVSGMTDRFALGMYRQLEGISVGSMTPAPLAIK